MISIATSVTAKPSTPAETTLRQCRYLFQYLLKYLFTAGMDLRSVCAPRGPNKPRFSKT